jgi:hypothetical protein
MNNLRISRGGQSAYEFRYALFRYVVAQGKWEAAAFFWRYQTVSQLALVHQEYCEVDLTSAMCYGEEREREGVRGRENEIC